MSIRRVLLSFVSLSIFAQVSNAIDLDIDDTTSICSAASIVADKLITYYEGSGLFQDAYWWQSGTALGSLLNFQKLCGNSTYEDIVYEGLLAQTGDSYNYQPSSQDGNIGNDDIGAWALSAMLAAEMDFKAPNSGVSSWVQLATNSFNLLYSRWDTDECNGGLRWQYETSRSGYDYKATIANVNLFQLAARLANYYGDVNSTYYNAAEEIYEWISGTGLVNYLEYGAEVYDGFSISDNCTDITKVLWTYNYGTLLAGTAHLYDLTKDSTWKDNTESIILGSQILYNNTVLYERACELYDTCNSDQRIFKGVYTRYLGVASELISSLDSKVQGLIEPSAEAAAKSCTGGSDGVTCGEKWGYGYYDGISGVGEQVNALEIIQNLLA